MWETQLLCLDTRNQVRSAEFYACIFSQLGACYVQSVRYFLLIFKELYRGLEENVPFCISSIYLTVVD